MKKVEVLYKMVTCLVSQINPFIETIDVLYLFTLSIAKQFYRRVLCQLLNGLFKAIVL